MIYIYDEFDSVAELYHPGNIIEEFIFKDEFVLYRDWEIDVIRDSLYDVLHSITSSDVGFYFEELIGKEYSKDLILKREALMKQRFNPKLWREVTKDSIEKSYSKIWDFELNKPAIEGTDYNWKKHNQKENQLYFMRRDGTYKNFPKTRFATLFIDEDTGRILNPSSADYQFLNIVQFTNGVRMYISSDNEQFCESLYDVALTIVAEYTLPEYFMEIMGIEYSEKLIKYVKPLTKEHFNLEFIPFEIVTPKSNFKTKYYKKNYDEEEDKVELLEFNNIK